MVLTSGALFTKRDEPDTDSVFKLRLRWQQCASRIVCFPSLGLSAMCRATGYPGRLGEAARRRTGQSKRTAHDASDSRQSSAEAATMPNAWRAASLAAALRSLAPPARAWRFHGDMARRPGRPRANAMAPTCHPTPSSRSGLRLRQDRRSILSYCPERTAPMACSVRVGGPPALPGPPGVSPRLVAFARGGGGTLHSGSL